MGKFVVRKVRGGAEFHLHAVNGGVIAVSGVCPNEQICMRRIDQIRRCAKLAAVEDQTADGAPQAAPKFEIFLDKDGLFRFRLRAEDGAVLAVSEGYKAKASCRNGIASVRRNAPDAQAVQ